MVNINSILMILLYVPSSLFLSERLFRKLGVHWTVAIGCGLNVLCLVLRLCISLEGLFVVAMLGGFSYGIAQPLIMNANAEIASNWFSTAEV